MSKILLVFLILKTCLSFCQKAYQFPEYFDPAYDFKPEEAHKLILEKKPSGSKLDIERYITTVVYGEQYKFDNNDVYLNWSENEKYLKKIVNEILPPNEMNKNISIFVGRSHYSNSDISRFGNLVFNIGKISNEESETHLAYHLARDCARYLFKHMLKTDSEALRLQADSFAFAILLKKNLIRDTVIKVVYKEDDPDITYQKGAKNGDLVNKTIYLAKQNYFVDSISFKKIKKLANEEKKKIAFEECDFNSCLEFSFLDYLSEPKNIKNLYYVIESIRRSMYVKPETRTLGFLTQKYGSLDLYYYNKSVLFDPSGLINNKEQYFELKEHNFFSKKDKPFNTNEEAFVFFTQQALTCNFNEANFSRALDFQGTNKTDSAKKYLNEYLKNGIGLYTDLAKSMLDKGHPYIEKGKTFVLYNNVEHVSEDFFNYYLSRKRKLTNEDFKNEVGKDTNSVKVLIVNELLGKNPKKLNQCQRLMNSVFSLFNEGDREMCKKIARNSNYAGEDKVLANKYKKNFLIYAPEWYTFYKENQCNKLFFINVKYHYFEFMNEIEYYNFYTGYYLEANSDRPYFRDPTRKGVISKHTEKEIRKDIIAFMKE